MIAPFILVEGLDVTMYPSLAALTGYVEAQDVRDGVYEAFDAAGQEVKLAALADSSPVTAQPGAAAGNRLRTLLIDHLLAIGPQRAGAGDRDVATADLASLVRLLWAFHTDDHSPRS